MPDEVTLAVGDGPDEEKRMAFPEYMELGNLQGAMSSLGQEFAAAAGRRVARFDELGADSSSMWAVSLQSPTVMAAHGMRIAGEAGAGRSRIESNSPASTQTVGG